jgi:agmatine/peptidylarginine deiminase
MKHLRNLIFICIAVIGGTVSVHAQETKKPDWKKLHYLSEEEMLSGERSMLFQETTPPSGTVRFPAEFEPMQAVTIRYPLGIPTSLVKQLSERTKVYVIVSAGQQNNARNTFQNAGCNMSNITYYNMATDSYWVRDYGPWYIFNDLEPAIVDNVYNRPRQNDNMVPIYMGQELGLNVYGMNLTHTGGNMMEDGRGVGVSDELVLNENNNNETNVRNKMRNYLGIDPYHITIDPQGDYIAHVDCWGKFLAPDKILIAQLPTTNSQYDEYEQVAELFANTNCCWGYPYKVYRVYEPGGNTLAPYTNSLIVNNTVFVPMGNNTTHNNNALAVYQQAMPGYEIIGVTGASGTPWQNTDALHCRTRGVMDFNMLFVDHRNVVFGEQPMQDSIAITSKFIAYSGKELKTDSLLVYYSIDGAAYQTANMTTTGNPYEYVGYIKGYHYGSSVDYYVFGADKSGHRYSQPSYGALEPHHFVIEEGPATVEQTVTLNAGWNWWSTNLDLTLDDLKADIVAALGINGTAIIKSQGATISYQDGQWRPASLDFNIKEMYEIYVNSNCEITMSGIPVNPAEYEITIYNGANWIGFLHSVSMTLSNAFGTFPVEGDMVKSNAKSAVYQNGQWRGELVFDGLQPGQGYIYVSNVQENRIFNFPTDN